MAADRESERAQLLELLTVVKALPLGGHGAFTTVVDSPEVDWSSQHLRELALAQVDEARRSLELSTRLKLWWRLRTRREVSGLSLHPRRRRTLELSIDAIRLAIEWTDVDRQTASGKVDSLGARSAEIDRESRRHLRSEGAATLAYNVASMMACSYAALAGRQESTGRSREQMAAVSAAAVGALTRAYGSPGSRIYEGDLDYLAVDTDFDVLGEQPQLGAFCRRFESESAADRERRVFGGVLSEVRAAARRLRDQWDDRLLSLKSSKPPERSDVPEWFRHDVAIWHALAEWIAAPAVEDARLAFAEVVGRSVGEPVSSVGPSSYPRVGIDLSGLRTMLGASGPGATSIQEAATRRRVDDLIAAAVVDDSEWRTQVRGAIRDQTSMWEELLGLVDPQFTTPAVESAALDTPLDAAAVSDGEMTPAGNGKNP